jgi:tetratricopeptide (TPR) repeat protein
MSPEEITEKAIRAATRMYLEDRPQVALDYLAEALAADPDCYEALVMAGELYDRWGPELGFAGSDGALKSLCYFDHAIAVRPDHAEAYAEKAIALPGRRAGSRAPRCPADTGQPSNRMGEHRREPLRR